MQCAFELLVQKTVSFFEIRLLKIPNLFATIKLNQPFFYQPLICLRALIEVRNKSAGPVYFFPVFVVEFSKPWFENRLQA
jgi:hypothetical protein